MTDPPQNFTQDPPQNFTQDDLVAMARDVAIPYSARILDVIREGKLSETQLRSELDRIVELALAKRVLLKHLEGDSVQRTE